MNAELRTGEQTPMTFDKGAARKVLEQAKIGPSACALMAPEARSICEAYGITLPAEGVAHDRRRRGDARQQHRVSGGHEDRITRYSCTRPRPAGVLVGLKSAEQVAQGFEHDHPQLPQVQPQGRDHRRADPADAAGGQEVIIGAVTDPAFGKLVAFGLGGILVEVLKDITFRLAPATNEDALSMLDGIAAAEILRACAAPVRSIAIRSRR